MITADPGTSRGVFYAIFLSLVASPVTILVIGCLAY
jgi:hypothetical protein